MSATKFLAPVVGTIAIAAAGTAAYMHFKNTSKDLMTPLAIAQVVPDDAYMATFISADEQTWAKLKQFGTPEAQTVITKNWNTLQQQLVTQSNIDIEKDLKPWVGNTMVALLPNQGAKQKPSLLVVISIKDKISAMNFAMKLANQGSSKAKESDYQGNKIIENTDNSVFAAVVKDYLVIASDRKGLEEAINTTKGQPSFASKPGADNLLTKGVDVQNSIAQVYLVDYATAMQQLTNINYNQATSIPSATLDQLKRFKSLVAGIGTDEAGVRIKAVAAIDPQAPKWDYKPAPGKVIAQLPADTLAFVSGANLNSYWNQATQQAKAYPDGEQAIAQVRQAFNSANFDLDKDIFGWMDGEFGMALIPSNQGILSQLGFGGVMVFNTSDRKSAENALSKLDNLAKGNAVLVQQREVQGKKITEWNSPMGAVLGHGWLDDNSVFLAFGGPLAETMASKPTQTLNLSDTFQGITGNLPKQNLGYVYVDMDKTLTILNRFAAASPRPIPADTIAVLNSIRGIGITSTQADSSTGQVDMSLALKKAK
ncbi:MAG: metalloendopeptidase [Leptolyngbya sp.]|nr:MAG: metalloendopeptidase [Leptolyngbya sp.]